LLSTQNTDDGPGWLQLLSSLTDEELHRYGQIAADQKRLEWRYGWAQAVCVVGAIAAFAWFLREFSLYGLTSRGVALLLLAGVFGYWPYRKARVRLLWGRHCKAVARESAQRGLVRNKR